MRVRKVLDSKSDRRGLWY